MSYTLQFDVSGVTTNETRIDDATQFNVQWKAQNLGPGSTDDFTTGLSSERSPSAPKTTTRTTARWPTTATPIRL